MQFSMITKRFHARTHVFILGVLIAVSTYWLWSQQQTRRISFSQGLRVGQPQLKCFDLQGVDDIVILLKTGVNEVDQKLPVLIRTLFTCTHKVLIYSDVEQEYQGLHIRDALNRLPKLLNSSDPDLIHYNRLQEEYTNGTTSSVDRQAGWKLDRFKYMPMMSMAYKTYPNAKWFVFIETDTAVMWSNLVTWLSQLDHQKPMYIGSEVVGGKAPDGKNDIIFAHGGSGFVVSQIAASMLTRALSSDEQRFMDFAKNDCCGDAGLARAFWDLGVKITPAFPHSNGETPESSTFKKEWCYAPVFFHHVDEGLIERVHFLDERHSSATTLTFANVFEEFVWNHLEAKKSDWDNRSDDKVFKKGKKAAKSFEDCREACLKSWSWKCMQYSYRDGECRLGNSLRYGGGKQEGVISGWNLQSIEAFREKNRNCRPKWIVK